MEVKASIINDLLSTLRREDDAHKQQRMEQRQHSMNYVTQAEKELEEMESLHRVCIQREEEAYRQEQLINSQMAALKEELAKLLQPKS